MGFFGAKEKFAYRFADLPILEPGMAVKSFAVAAYQSRLPERVDRFRRVAQFLLGASGLMTAKPRNRVVQRVSFLRHSRTVGARILRYCRALALPPDGVVTLPCEKRERSTPYAFSSRRDGLAPRGHRRGA